MDSFDLSVPVRKDDTSQRISLGCSLPPESRLVSIISSTGFPVGGSVSDMNDIRGMEIKLGTESLPVTSDGLFTFKNPLLPGQQLEFEVSRNPVHQDCELVSSGETTTLVTYENRNLDLVCIDKESNDLYSLDKLHHLAAYHNQVRMAGLANGYTSLELQRSNGIWYSVGGQFLESQ